MYDPNDYFSNDINSEYWDDVYYEKHHPNSSYSRGGNGGGIVGPAFLIGLLVESIFHGGGAYVFLVVLFLLWIAKKCK